MYGQIIAPDLYCVKGDTLRWSVPGNSCGTETGYIIFFATSKSGPYTVLDTVTDLTQTEYIHTNSPGGSLFYFMITQASCPGEIVLHSDTLDNNSPNPVLIRYASVNGNSIDLAWTKSTSPEVVAYIVFRRDPDGSIIRLDTVQSFNLTDTSVDPHNYSYGYYVTAVDQCWVSSTFNNEHRTMLLSGSIDTCKATARLDFSSYQGFDSLNYELWTSTNGGTPVKEAMLSANSFIKSGLIPNDTYSFRIKAINKTNGEIAWSNEVSLTMYSVHVLRSLCLQSIDTSSDISFLSDVVIPNGGLQYFIAESPGDILGSTLRFSPSLSGNSFGLVEDLGNRFLQALSINSCGDSILSNIIQGIVLTGTLANARTIHLSWNPVAWENATTHQYRLLIRQNNSWSEIFRTGTDPMEYDYAIPANSESTTNYCFKVEVDLTDPCNPGAADIITASNIVCVDKTAGFFMPNAFKRGGVTPEFKPVIYFPENIQSFEMRIFDRWGNQLYYTTDPAKGWSGRKGYQDSPVGTYIYLVRLVSSNGKVAEQKGTVLLLD